MNSELKQSTSAQCGVMLRIKTALAKTITKSFGMTVGYLNATIRSSDKENISKV
jgi:hypothetical protein